MISPALLLRCGHVFAKYLLGDGRSCSYKPNLPTSHDLGQTGDLENLKVLAR
jgi:hypothetical protein